MNENQSENGQKPLEAPQIDPHLHIEGDHELEATESNDFLDEQDSFFTRLLDIVRDFEAGHPYLFFGVISLCIFFVIYLIITPFLGSDNSDTENTQQVTETVTENNTTFTSNYGALQGISTALYFENEEAINALKRVDLSVFDVDTSVTGETFLATELVLARQIEEAITIDIQQLMERSSDNETDYTTYLQSLQKLEQLGTVKYEDLLEMHDIFLERIENTSKERDSSLEALNNALANDSPKEITHTLEAYTDVQESLVKLQVRDSLTVDVIKSLGEPLMLLRARIVGLIANKELIIQNLVAVDVDGDGLEIIQEGNVEDYYPEMENSNTSLPTFNGSNPTNTTLPNGTNIPTINVIGWDEFEEEASQL